VDARNTRPMHQHGGEHIGKAKYTGPGPSSDESVVPATVIMGSHRPVMAVHTVPDLADLLACMRGRLSLIRYAISLGPSTDDRLEMTDQVRRNAIEAAVLAIDAPSVHNIMCAPVHLRPHQHAPSLPALGSPHRRPCESAPCSHESVSV
jgi:hypothetical protein